MIGISQAAGHLGRPRRGRPGEAQREAQVVGVDLADARLRRGDAQPHQVDQRVRRLGQRAVAVLQLIHESA